MKSIKKVFKFIKIILFLAIITFLVIFIMDYNKKQKQEVKYYPSIQDVTASINKYYIYGRHLNIEGVLNEQLNQSEIKDIELVLKTKETTLAMKTSYEIGQTKVTFKTSDLINDGIILDDIGVGNYYLLLRTTFKDDRPAVYYTLKNDTKYGNLDYYTITNNAKNKYITINFIKDNRESYVLFNVIDKKLPSNVYDIVLDPGHGGKDPGAVYNKQEEATINLSIAKKVQAALEKMGFKVKLTRDGDNNPGNRTGIDPYGAGGRVSIPFEAKAKYMFSIHINSNAARVNKGGLEVYIPDLANLDLARLFVTNILANTKIIGSVNPEYKKENGIYVRSLSNSDIAELKKTAEEQKFTMYNINSSTPYNYIIRETGGIATFAYVDGRNTKYSKNDYYNSNIGIETYLLELGYINNADDADQIINNQDGYAKGISNAIENYLSKK